MILLFFNKFGTIKCHYEVKKVIVVVVQRNSSKIVIVSTQTTRMFDCTIKVSLPMLMAPRFPHCLQHGSINKNTAEWKLVT